MNGPSAWLNADGGQFTANANDITEWDGAAWSVVFNSQEAVALAKEAFNNSPEKVDSQMADFFRKVLANSQSTAEQKARAKKNLQEMGLTA